MALTDGDEARHTEPFFRTSHLMAAQKTKKYEKTNKCFPANTYCIG